MQVLQNVLNSIGKATFVNYYYDFQNCNGNQKLAKKLLQENDAATSFQAQETRVSKAKWIFCNKREKEALKIIINSKRLDAEIIRKAQEILDNH